MFLLYRKQSVYLQSKWYFDILIFWTFWYSIKAKLENLNGSTHEFETAFYSVVNKHAPNKGEMLRCNTKSFIIKKIKKSNFADHGTCTDQNLKIVSANVELMKTGTVIKFNEITVKPLKKKKEYLKLNDI